MFEMGRQVPEPTYTRITIPFLLYEQFSRDPMPLFLFLAQRPSVLILLALQSRVPTQKPSAGRSRTTRH